MSGHKIFAAALVMGAFFACSSSDNNGSLSLPNAPATLKVGQSVSTAPATEEKRDPEGRLETNAQFTQYDLITSDSTVVKVVNFSVVGVAAGTATVTAQALDGSGLSSGKYSITVTP